MEPDQAELAELLARPMAPAASARVLELRRLGALRSPAAMALAAAWLLDAEDLAAVQAAHELALQAMATERTARRLAAASFDRLRVLQGLPQKFGTQRRADGTVWPIDPATTDSERRKWDLPPRHELEVPPAGDCGR